MKQLNNKKTGKIIRLVYPICISQNAIVYDLFEHGMTDISERKIIENIINKSFIPEIPMNWNDLSEYLIFQEIISKNPDFEISEDIQNWAVEKGSENNDTTIRVFLPKELEDLARTNRDNSESDYFALYQLISKIEQYLPAKTSIPSESGKTQYLEMLLDDDRAILEKYPEIIIEGRV